MEAMRKLVEVPRRRTFTAQWKENQVVEIPLPKDTSIVGLHIRIKGYTKYTFTAGTPVGRSEGAMDSLIKAIEVNTDRLGTIKYLRPHFLQMQQFLAMGVAGQRLYSTGASSTAFPTTEGAFNFGVTTNFTSIMEAAYMPFEQLFCEPGMGRELTYLNTRRSTNAVLKFYCQSLSNLCANSSGVTALAFDAANTSFDIEVTTVERQDIDASVIFDVWKQVQKTENFLAQVDDKFIDINTENRLSGLMLYTVDGSSPKAASNKLIKKLVLKKNGQENLQEISFPALQDANRIDYGIIASPSAGLSRLDGFAHLSQISRREIGTALDTRKDGGGVFSLALAVSTNDSSTVTYTAGAELNIVTEEIVPGR